MQEKESRFMYFELLFYKINLGLLGFGFVMLGLMFVFIDTIESAASFLLSFSYMLMIAAAAAFGLSIVRILKYFIRYKKVEDATIWRSFVSLLLSTGSTLFFLVITLILALSTASCTIG